MIGRNRGLCWCALSLVLGTGCLHESTPSTRPEAPPKVHTAELESAQATKASTGARAAQYDLPAQAAAPVASEQLGSLSMAVDPASAPGQERATRPKAEGKSVQDSFGAAGYGVGGGGLARARSSASAPALAMHMPPSADLNREAYSHIAEHDFHQVRDQPLSTFSVDVDTASYSNVRRFVRDGQLPPADVVRIEELVNYFDYDYPQPEAGTPFAIYAEVGACPWNPEHRLVHIGIAGQEAGRDARAGA